MKDSEIITFLATNGPSKSSAMGSGKDISHILKAMCNRGDIEYHRPKWCLPGQYIKPKPCRGPIAKIKSDDILAVLKMFEPCTSAQVAVVMGVSYKELKNAFARIKRAGLADYMLSYQGAGKNAIWWST